MGPRKRPISDELKDTVSKLYPHINEKRTPLPRYWSHEDKCDHLGLSNGNLIVTYKGQGVEKSHKDAGSVRTAVPIPTGIGIYYFEIFIISKGRDGFMGIGISPTSQSNLNRLPGWDKDSYGYHGDDGNSFCSKGSGQPYGPTFTTGDTVGCGVNFVDRTCFFTKNGINLGSVVTDLPLRSFYPTVGLQTPGETVEANFGQKPFVFDLSDLKFEAKYFINKAVTSRPVERSQLQSLVSSYLIHRGYSNAAASFAKQTGLAVPEGMQSIENRNQLEKLVMEGSISEALKETEKRYPTLLNDNPKLEFLLKCRQFVELIMGGSEDSIESSQSSSDSSNEQCNGTLNGVPVAVQEGARPEPELQPQENLHLNGVVSDILNNASNGAASVVNENTSGAENSSDELVNNAASQLPEVESLDRRNQTDSQDSNGSCDMELDSNSCHATVPENSVQSRELLPHFSLNIFFEVFNECELSRACLIKRYKHLVIAMKTELPSQ